MRKIIILASFLVSLSIASIALAETTHKPLTVDTGTDPSYRIVGPMDVRLLASLATLLDAVKTKNVHIAISSPGGHVAAANLLSSAIEALKARGVTVHCYVGGMAASAAFDVLLSCSKRHATERSTLMFHPPALEGVGRVTIHVAQLILEDLWRIHGTWLTHITEMLPMSADMVEHHYRRETYFTARELDALLTDPEWITIHKSIAFRVPMPDLSIQHVTIPMTFGALAANAGEVVEGACYIVPIIKGTVQHVKVIQVTGKMVLVELYVGNLSAGQRVMALSALAAQLALGDAEIDVGCKSFDKRPKQK